MIIYMQAQWNGGEDPSPNVPLFLPLLYLLYAMLLLSHLSRHSHSSCPHHHLIAFFSISCLYFEGFTSTLPKTKGHLEI